MYSCQYHHVLISPMKKPRLREGHHLLTEGSPGQSLALSPSPLPWPVQDRNFISDSIPVPTAGSISCMLIYPPRQERTFYLKVRWVSTKTVASLGTSEPQILSLHHQKSPQWVSICQRQYSTAPWRSRCIDAQPQLEHPQCWEAYYLSRPIT